MVVNPPSQLGNVLPKSVEVQIAAATADPRVPISANPGLYEVVAGYGDPRRA